ncbi:MAG: sensor histidine kinase [Wolinella sp.]
MNANFSQKRYKNNIALIIFISFIPFFIYDFYKNWTTLQGVQERVAENTILQVDSLVRIHSQALFSVQKEMTLLSKVNVIKEAKNPECTEFLRAFGALSSSYVNLSVTAPNGKILCSLTSLPIIADEIVPTMMRAQKEGRFIIGETVKAVKLNSIVTPFALPLEPAKGLLSPMLIASGNINSWFNEVSLKRSIHKHVSLYIIGAQGEVLTTYPQNTAPLDMKLLEHITTRTKLKERAAQGIWWREGVSSDGKRLMMILERQGNIKIIATLDLGAIESEDSRVLWQSLAYLLAMILGAFLLAAFTARELIFKEVNALFKIAISQSKYTATSELLSSIAHQWRQPLNGLNLQVSLLRDSIEGDLGNKKEWIEHLSMIEQTIHSLSHSITRLSNFFKQDKLKQKFRIQVAAKEALSFVKNSLDENSISYSITGDDVEITQCKNELVQNILSLLQNSIEAFGASNIQGARSIEIETREVGNLAQIIIRDNAGGINEEMVDKLFQPYTTSKFQSEGVGLSLFILKSIIEREMGGTISVRNVNGGAEFTISIPLI